MSAVLAYLCDTLQVSAFGHPDGMYYTTEHNDSSIGVHTTTSSNNNMFSDVAYEDTVSATLYHFRSSTTRHCDVYMCVYTTYTPPAVLWYSVDCSLMCVRHTWLSSVTAHPVHA
jgi:hypothetical protein